MKNFFSSFHTTAKDIRLTHAERRHIYTRVLGAINETERSVVSPYAHPSFFMRFASAAFVLLLIVGVSGGTAFAAEGSVPGDALYGIKVGVTEPIELALAVTPEGRASMNASIAARRLSEAEVLAGEGRLTASTSAELAVNFNSHAVAAYAAARSLANSNPAAAGEFSANFSNLIATKGMAILTASASTKNATSIRASGTLVVSATTRGTEDGSSAASVTASGATPAASGAGERAHRAHQAVSDLSSAIQASNSSASDTLTARQHAAALANLVVKADAEAALGSTTAADDDYQAALTNASAIQTSLHSSQKSQNGSIQNTPSLR